MQKSNKKPYTKKTESNEEPFEVGRVQPSAVELEEAILGGLLLDKSLINIIINILHPESFYKTANKTIYQAILNLFERSTSIDYLTIITELKRVGELENIGGTHYIIGLTTRSTSHYNMEFCARVISEKYMQRSLIAYSTNNIKDCYQDTTDIFELIDKAQTTLNTLMSTNIKSKEKGSRILLNEFMKQLEIISTLDNTITGVPTTLTKLNNVTKGFQKSDLIIIAGRPAMGKSASLKNCIKGAINTLKKPVLLFSLEMSASQQIARLLSEDLHISSQDFNSKEFLTKTNWNSIASKFSGYYGDDGKDLLIIDDSPVLTINELKAKAKRIHSENPICMICVDYLQMVRATSENKVYELEEVCSGLKALAKEIDVPVVALCQLNREVEKQAPYRPTLAHIRSSGAIEQYADLVIFLYRPEYYKIMTTEDGTSTVGLAEWIVAKHRNGGLDTIRTKFTDYLTKFEDYGNDEYTDLNGKPENKDFDPF